MSKKLAILGAGESGVGTAILGKKQGYNVFVSDFGAIATSYKQILDSNNISWEEKGHTLSQLENATIVMKSPGIPDTAPVVKTLRENGIKVLSEIEIASWYTDAKLIGITGSNGKTTTASLTYALLKEGGLDVALGGNIGLSFAHLVSKHNYSHFVLELSSFQLDGIEKFAPHIAILTNITPDHLDRYNNDFDAYVASKFLIAKNQTPQDYFIYDADDPVIVEGLKKHHVPAQKIPFSLKQKLSKGAYLEQENLIINIDDNQFIMPISKLGLEGQHNVKNAMAASTTAKLLSIRKTTIRESLEKFQGVEHRLEKVLKINNVMYINDSKATNVNATYFALDSMESPTVWIVGGVDKGNDYSELLPLVNEKVRAIICLGVDNQKIISAFGNVVEMLVETHSMKDAVQVAYRIAERHNTVLLSPACASFDLFENYEDRGRQFKDAIRKL